MNKKESIAYETNSIRNNVTFYILGTNKLIELWYGNEKSFQNVTYKYCVGYC